LSKARVFVLVGDAELDEGSNSEAIVYAGAVGLPNLTVIAVDNQSSTYGWGPGGIEAHFAVGGWSTVRVSGRDHEALASAFRVTASGAASAGPQLVVATVEGEE
ncbi:MAG TPA: transketolase, partial [Streptosporangiaceae bacterium]|nr:transketolase [Streptosporangiaceae bacterium]